MQSGGNAMDKATNRTVIGENYLTTKEEYDYEECSKKLRF
jgi:hypothetical protein